MSKWCFRPKAELLRRKRKSKGWFYKKLAPITSSICFSFWEKGVTKWERRIWRLSLMKEWVPIGTTFVAEWKKCSWKVVRNSTSFWRKKKTKKVRRSKRTIWVKKNVMPSCKTTLKNKSRRKKRNRRRRSKIRSKNKPKKARCNPSEWVVL